MGHTVADVVDALEGRDDLFVMVTTMMAVSNFRAMSLRMRITAMARSESSGAVGSSARITGDD